MNSTELRTHLSAVTRDRLGRFVNLTRLRECSDRSCHDAVTWPDAVEQHDAFLETMEEMLRTVDPAEVEELVGVVRAYRLDLRRDLETVADDDVEKRPRLPTEWVRGQGVGEVMDVTGLEPRDASQLALRLANWTGKHRKKGPVYIWRDGKRYVRTGVWRVNLNDPIMAPFRDDILEMLSDPTTRRELDREDAPDDLEVFDDAYAALEEHPPLPRLRKSAT